jgi:hypothetical protein
MFVYIPQQTTIISSQWLVPEQPLSLGYNKPQRQMGPETHCMI